VLFVAAAEGHAEVALLLINRGADTTIKNKLGKTADQACRFASVAEIIRKRIARGASEEDQQEDDPTPVLPEPLTASIDTESPVRECGTPRRLWLLRLLELTRGMDRYRRGSIDARQ